MRRLPSKQVLSSSVSLHGCRSKGSLSGCYEVPLSYIKACGLHVYSFIASLARRRAPPTKGKSTKRGARARKPEIGGTFFLRHMYSGRRRAIYIACCYLCEFVLDIESIQKLHRRYGRHLVPHGSCHAVGAFCRRSSSPEEQRGRRSNPPKEQPAGGAVCRRNSPPKDVAEGYWVDNDC